MFSDVFATGGGLEWVLGGCATVAVVIYLFQITAPTVRRWFRRDVDRATQDLLRRRYEAANPSVEDRLSDALSHRPDGPTAEGPA